MRESWRRWRAGAVTVALLVIAVAGVEWLWVDDFKPFVMTIEEWNADRIGYEDGTTVAGSYVYRLEYQRHDEWKMTLIHDDLGNDLTGEVYECHDGVYLRFDAHGDLSGRMDDPAYCRGVGRWIHYGLAQHWVWARTVSGNEATYTDAGERIVFDLATGLPRLYEAASSRTGVVSYRMNFRLERYGSP